MQKITCVLAILAAASTAAVAKDLKQDNKAAVPTVAATQMTDAEMDKVTAGAGASVQTPGPGVTVTLPLQGSAAAGASGAANTHAGSNPAILGL